MADDDLGLLEVSLGYAEALTALQPMLDVSTTFPAPRS